MWGEVATTDGVAEDAHEVVAVLGGARREVLVYGAVPVGGCAVLSEEGYVGEDCGAEDEFLAGGFAGWRGFVAEEGRLHGG